MTFLWLATVTPRPLSIILLSGQKGKWEASSVSKQGCPQLGQRESLFLGTILTYRKQHVVFMTTGTQVCCITDTGVCVCVSEWGVEKNRNRVPEIESSDVEEGAG